MPFNARHMLLALSPSFLTNGAKVLCASDVVRLRIAACRSLPLSRSGQDRSAFLPARRVRAPRRCADDALRRTTNPDGPLISRPKKPARMPPISQCVQSLSAVRSCLGFHVSARSLARSLIFCEISEKATTAPSSKKFASQQERTLEIMYFPAPAESDIPDEFPDSTDISLPLECGVEGRRKEMARGSSLSYLQHAD